MTRKSILQIVLLIVLLVAGAGAYLLQQEGGLDVIRELAGLERAQPIPPPSPTPTPTPRQPPASTAAPKPEPSSEQALAIPAHPAKGRIQRTAFTVESASLENGVLTLRQGDDPLATEVKVFLNTKPWHVPAERSFQILGDASAADAPLIRIRWQETGQEAQRQRDFTDKFTLRLELGREGDRKLPGKIYLALPDEEGSQVVGTFTAEVRGFRFIDGKPDLAGDSVDTLQYLALHEILKDDPDMSIGNLAFRNGRYTLASPLGPGTGYLEVEYAVGEEAPIMQKFQFVKERNAWRVVGTLRPDQLDEAHPHRLPRANDAPERLFPYLAAKRIEADAQKRLPGRTLHATGFATRYNEKQKIGVAEVNYRVGDGQIVHTAFLYQRGPSGWSLVRELSKKERVNLATGKVETQR